MVVQFYIKKNDTYPPLRATLQQADGTPVNLEGARVQFLMRDDDYRDKIYAQGEAMIVDAEKGIVEYRWREGDTAIPGYYLAEFVVTFATGQQLTIPNQGFITIQVQK